MSQSSQTQSPPTKPGYRTTFWWRVYDEAAQAADHAVGWDKLPRVLGLVIALPLLTLTADFFGILAGWIATKFSAVAARSAMRVMFLGLLVLFFFDSRWLPDVMGIGSLAAVSVAAVALLGLRRLVA